MATVTSQEPLRLLMTADAVGGVWQYSLDLAAALAAQGIETTLALLGPAPSSDQEVEAQAVPGLKLVPTNLPLDWLAVSRAEVLEAAAAFAGLARDLAPDLIHLNSPALGAVALPAPTLAACHSCVATWWAAVKPGPLPQDFVWRTRLTSDGYGAARALVAPSAAFAAATARVYGLAVPPFAVHNGRRLRTVASLPDGVPGEPFAFTAGRLWDEGKNIAALDRAAARLSAPLYAAGPLTGPNGAAIAPANLNPLGRLGDREVAGWLAAKPVFVSAARYEPFGLAVLEAAQAGCALVLSDIPTFRELWDGAALFVAPDDERGIAQAVEGLLRDPAARELRGAHARERSLRYSADAMAAGLVEIYRSLVPLRFEAPRRREAVA